MSWFRLGTIAHRRMPEMMVSSVKIHQTTLNGQDSAVGLNASLNILKFLKMLRDLCCFIYKY
ncbi:MAG: hypothetical protein LW808_001910 [Verrucomicrobiota bacterium]|nr:MAG: hypothetical protein LW808_001910 [Verrucomicrobiota bacterium]